MKKRLMIGFVLIFFLSACTSMNISTATVDIRHSNVDVQQGMDKTQEYFTMQTIIALEQATDTPTPGALSNLPKPWTEITTLTPIPTSTTTPIPTSTTTPIPTSTTHSAIASIVQPYTSIMQGPGFNYRIACYVDEGIQLMITGRNSDSSWLRITFGQEQNCYLLGNNAIQIFIPDPTLQFWISYSKCTISGDLSDVAIIIPTPTRP